MSVLEILQMGAYRFRRVPKEDLGRVFGLFPVLAQRRNQEAGTRSGGEQ
jgi:branched-chain amino acid transport system ATP-binding protein